MPKLTQQELDAHLRGAANILRGKTAGQDYSPHLDVLQTPLGPMGCRGGRERRPTRGAPAPEVQRCPAPNSHGVTPHPPVQDPDGCHWDDVPAVSENIGAMINAATRGGPDPRDPTNKRQLVGIAPANPELRGVFTVDWTSPHRTARAGSSPMPSSTSWPTLPSPTIPRGSGSSSAPTARIPTGTAACRWKTRNG